ncbi:hypothetical protein BaRGS_00034314 [Batillaria attramentaria]|uniref:Uncharacterized protein n=1 Tax=Batillaria attramentaria TaxID=370345 RepID=A0ABD0JHJ7_9CAEN
MTCPSWPKHHYNETRMPVSWGGNLGIQGIPRNVSDDGLGDIPLISPGNFHLSPDHSAYTHARAAAGAWSAREEHQESGKGGVSERGICSRSLPTEARGASLGPRRQPSYPICLPPRRRWRARQGRPFVPHTLPLESGRAIKSGSCCRLNLRAAATRRRHRRRLARACMRATCGDERAAPGERRQPR